MSEIIGYNGNAVEHNGELFSGYGRNPRYVGPPANCIIKRYAGSAQRPAVRWPCSANSFPPSAFERVTSSTPVFASDILFTGNIDYSKCHTLRVSTAHGSEVNPSLYFNYEPSSTEYIYINTSALDYSAHPAEQLDITNAGITPSDVSSNGILTAGRSEILRLELPEWTNTDVDGHMANCSDYSAVRNFYAPNLGRCDGLFRNYYGHPYDWPSNNFGTVYDGGTAQSSDFKYSAANFLEEIENWYTPKYSSDPYFYLFPPKRVKNCYMPKIEMNLFACEYAEKSVTYNTNLASAVYSSNGTSAWLSGTYNETINRSFTNSYSNFNISGAVSYTINDGFYAPLFNQSKIDAKISAVSNTAMSRNDAFENTEFNNDLYFKCASMFAGVFNGCTFNGPLLQLDVKHNSLYLTEPMSAVGPWSSVSSQFTDYVGSVLFKNTTIAPDTYVSAYIRNV
jgi:hypothetical protein